MPNPMTSDQTDRPPLHPHPGHDYRPGVFPTWKSVGCLVLVNGLLGWVMILGLIEAWMIVFG